MASARQPATPVNLIIALVVLLGICASFTAAALFDRRATSDVKSGVRTQGTIVDVRTFTRPVKGDLYTPRIAFTPAGGAGQVVIDGQQGVEPPEVGDGVEVSYDPADPAGAHPVDGHDDPSYLIGLGATGVVAPALAWIEVRRRLLRRRRQRSFDPRA